MYCLPASRLQATCHTDTSLPGSTVPKCWPEYIITGVGHYVFVMCSPVLAGGLRQVESVQQSVLFVGGYNKTSFLLCLVFLANSEKKQLKLATRKLRENGHVTWRNIQLLTHDYYYIRHSWLNKNSGLIHTQTRVIQDPESARQIILNVYMLTRL